MARATGTGTTAGTACSAVKVWYIPAVTAAGRIRGQLDDWPGKKLDDWFRNYGGWLVWLTVLAVYVAASGISA